MHVPHLIAPSRGAQVRTAAPQMFNLDPWDGVWGFEAKKAVFDAWDPEKPRDYQNFNPFERNDEAQMCDGNGCFPGQSKGYKPPNRPDVSWAIQQEISKATDALKESEPKFSVTGKPGNFSPKWQDTLGPPMDSW